MRAGILNEPIEILKVVVSRNEYGEQQDNYMPVCHTKAEVRPTSGGRSNENNEIFYEHTLTFTMRRYVKVDDFDRIMYKCKQYRILNIDDDRAFNQKIVTAELIQI